MTRLRGAWCWSLSPEHTADKFVCDLSGAAAFAAGKTDLGPIGSSVPPATSMPLPSPTATGHYKRILATPTRRTDDHPRDPPNLAPSADMLTVTAGAAVTAIVDEVRQPALVDAIERSALNNGCLEPDEGCATAQGPAQGPPTSNRLLTKVFRWEVAGK